MVFIDECHATGFFGKTGRGTEEFFEMVKICKKNKKYGKIYKKNAAFLLQNVVFETSYTIEQILLILHILFIYF